jgi:hypothetical protein
MSTSTAIGWCFERDEGVGVYFDPIPLSKLIRTKPQNSGISSCPAVNDFNSRIFTVQSPYTFKLRAVKRSDSDYSFHAVYPDTDVSESILMKEISFQPKSLWRDERFPILQLTLPYVFLSNASVFINQLEPNRFKGCKPWSLVEGRFDISTWHRPINWAVEWMDLSQDIVIKRGDPLFQLLFETDNQVSKITVKKIERDEAIERSIKKTLGITDKIKGSKKIIYDESNRLHIGALNEEN